jgi:hypothetical protein
MTHLFDICLQPGFGPSPDYYPRFSFHVGDAFGPNMKRVREIATLVEGDTIEEKIIRAVLAVIDDPRATVSTMRLVNLAISARQGFKGRRCWKCVGKTILQTIDASPFATLDDITDYKGLPRKEASRQIALEQLDALKSHHA